MKILHAITLADLGGAQSVLVNICNKAAEEGYDVYVVSEEYGKMWNSLSSKIHKIRIEELQRNVSLKNDMKVLLRLRKLYKEIKPDIIHLHSSKMGALGRLAFPKNKIIYTVHGFDSIRLAYRKFLIIEKLLKKRAKNIVAVSEYDKTNLNNEGINDKVVTIYNGIQDIDNSKKLQSKIDFAELKKDFKIIMCIARLSPPKRFDLFCEIAEKMINESIKFIWIGNKEDVQVGSKNIIMLGEIEDARNYFMFADLVILLSDYEGLPISIIEALAAGKPVIASNVGGISEILDEKNGFALPNNSDLFADKINFILKDDDTYNKYAANARKSYRDYFTIEQMYSKYLLLYGNVN